jgi:hypothetical protein
LARWYVGTVARCGTIYPMDASAPQEKRPLQKFRGAGRASRRITTEQSTGLWLTREDQGGEHRCIAASPHCCTTAALLHRCPLHAACMLPSRPPQSQQRARCCCCCWRSGEVRGGERAARKIPTSTRPNLEQAPSSAQSVLCWEPGTNEASRSRSLAPALAALPVSTFQPAQPSPAPAQESKQASRQASRQERKKGQKLRRARAWPGAGATRPGPLAPQINLPLSQQPA